MTDPGVGVEVNVQGALRLPKVHKKKQQGDGDGRDRHEFADNGQLAEFLIVVNIIRQYEHDSGSCHTYEKGELREVESPVHVAAESGDGQSIFKLLIKTASADCDDRAEKSYPEPVSCIALQGEFQHAVLLSGVSSGQEDSASELSGN